MRAAAAAGQTPETLGLGPAPVSALTAADQTATNNDASAVARAAQ